jgi:hypothetical protein
MHNPDPNKPRIQAHGQHSPATRAPSSRKGLAIRFVTRMTVDLDRAIAEHARRDGLTAGAWVRRTLLEKLALDSARDAKSGRPIRKPAEYEVGVASAVRELGAVNAAIAGDDKDAALAGIDRARSALIPLVVRRP